MFPNAKLSENLAIVASLSPIACASNALKYTSVFKLDKAFRYMAVIQWGNMTDTETCVVEIQTHDDVSFGAVTVFKTLTITAAAGNDNSISVIDLRPEDFVMPSKVLGSTTGNVSPADVSIPAPFVRLKITTGNTAGGIAGALVLAAPTKVWPASNLNETASGTTNPSGDTGHTITNQTANLV